MCESFLRTLGEDTDFEVDDALAKLSADGFLVVDEDSGEIRSLSICAPHPARPSPALLMRRAAAEVIARLDYLWEEYFYTQSSGAVCPFSWLLQDDWQ